MKKILAIITVVMLVFGCAAFSASAYDSFESSDGVLYFDLPYGFYEIDTSLDGQWMSDDNTYSIAVYSFANTAHEQLANLDYAGLEKVKNDVLSGAGASFSNVSIRNATANGYQGVCIVGDFVSGTVTADVELYMFATYDTAYSIYFYDFASNNGSSYKNTVINSIEFVENLYGATSTQVTEPSTAPTVPSTAPTFPSEAPTNPIAGDSSDVDVTDAPQTDDKEDDEDEDDEKETDYTLYVVIGAAALIVIILLFTVISLNKKKKASVQAPQFNQPFNDPVQYGNNPYNQNFNPANQNPSQPNQYGSPYAPQGNQYPSQPMQNPQMNQYPGQNYNNNNNNF